MGKNENLQINPYKDNAPTLPDGEDLKIGEIVQIMRKFGITYEAYAKTRRKHITRWREGEE